MGTPTLQKEMAKELNHHLETLHQELATMNQAVEEGLNQRRRPRPILVFPFSLLDRLINFGLLSLERLVRRLVTAIVR